MKKRTPAAKAPKQDIRSEKELVAWEVATGANNPDKRRRLALENAQPWAGRLAIVPVYVDKVLKSNAKVKEEVKEHAKEQAQAKTQAIAQGLVAGFDLQTLTQRIGVQGVNIHCEAADESMADVRLITEELLRRGLYARGHAHYRPSAAQTIPHHPSYDLMSDDQLTKANAKIGPQITGRGISLGTLINGARQYEQGQKGLGDNDPYVAVGNFRVADMLGIERPADLAPGAAWIMTGVDPEASKVQWERVA